MPEEWLVGSADGRCEEHVEVDRVLGERWVVFDECVGIKGELCLMCDCYERVLLRDPLIHCVGKGYLL